MAVRKQPWLERAFPTGLPATLMPVLLERLRGTSARLEERFTDLSPDILTRRLGQTWSIQENAGHLLDLEPLWMARVEDLLTQRPAMTPADLENRKTHEANHNAARLMVLLAEFRRVRAELVDKLQSAGAAALGYTAPHPRLGCP